MRKFIINVNGNSYEVEVEEITGGAAAPAAPTASAASVTPTPVVAAAPAVPAAPKAAPKGALVVNAPMPGTVLDIRVNEGQSVKKGDILLILEAMKMENEIFAPSDGKVTAIQTSKGASVNTGDALITLS